MRWLPKWLIRSAVRLIQKRSQALKAKLLSFSNTSSSYQLQHNIKACFCWNNLTLIVRECCRRSRCGAVTGCSETFGSKAVPAPSQLGRGFYEKAPFFFPFLEGGLGLRLPALAAPLSSVPTGAGPGGHGRCAVAGAGHTRPCSSSTARQKRAGVPAAAAFPSTPVTAERQLRGQRS